MQGYFLSNSDDRARLKLRANGPKSSVILTLEIDTGASNDLFIWRNSADELGLELEPDDDVAILADGTTKVKVMRAFVEIEWMGETRRVCALIWSPQSKKALQSKNRIDGLIGRRLLHDTHLSIDYVNRKVALTTPAHEGA